MRWEYLKNHRRGKYIKLLLVGKLNEHLYELDKNVMRGMGVLMEQMKAWVGITEELKTNDQMRWVGLMNNVKSVAERLC